MAIGDYVLATAWSKGSPFYPWATGIYAGTDSTGYYHSLVGFAGNPTLEGVKLRRAEKISRKTGVWLIEHKDFFTALPMVGFTLWGQVAVLEDIWAGKYAQDYDKHN